MIYLAIALLLVIPVLRFGYHFGDLDLVILSLRGIANANPTAFVNDWFVHQAPQPHWHFDLFTQWGESLGLLREFYFAYWLVTMAIFLVAVFRICRHLKIEKFLPLVILLLVLEPLHILGTIPLVGSWPLPHFLGGALGLLACGLWLEKKNFWLWIVVPLASLIHTQHGALVSLIIILGSMPRLKDRASAVLLGVLNLIIVFVAAKMRGLTEDGGVFVQMCREYIQGHCFAHVWPSELFIPMIPLGAALIIFGIRFWKKPNDSFAALILVTSAIAFFGTLADYLDIPFLADLYRRYFMHRITGYAMCFSLIGFIQVFFEKEENKIQLWAFRSLMAMALIGIFASSSSVLREEPALMNSAKAIPMMEDIGQKLRILVPPGETIVADPLIIWLRHASRRAVVTDIKALPYQADTFQEWKRRFDDLGGYQFKNLSYESLLQVMKKYNSHFVLLSMNDPKYLKAAQTMKPLMHIGNEMVIFIVEGKNLSQN